MVARAAVTTEARAGIFDGEPQDVRARHGRRIEKGIRVCNSLLHQSGVMRTMYFMRPNIILLTTDQQRGDCLGIDENAPACLQTPTLDALARAGTRFRRGYAECPSCIPSRRCLLTGTAPAAHGMVGMQGHDWNPPHTLPGELQRAGYHTYLIGKLHLQPRGKRFGFDHQQLSDSPLYPGDDYARWLQEAHGLFDLDAGSAHGQDPNGWNARPTQLREDQTHTHWCVSQALEFLKYKRDPSAPFFLNLSLFDPHPPLAPPAFHYDRYIRRQLPPPVIGDWAEPWEAPQKGLAPSAWRIKLDDQQMHCTRAAYYATINFIDDQIGRLLVFLTRNKLLKNTWILFTSDHGEMLGDHNLFRKCRPYEGSARVPFFVVPPGPADLPRNNVCEQPVGLQDVMPTLLDIAGVPIPKACTGHSLLPVIRGDRKPVRDVLHGEHAGQYESADAMHYLVSNRFKYVWYSQRPDEQLFDLQADPNELHDLARAADAAKLLRPWRERLCKILKDRPEKFVRGGKLRLGALHRCHLPHLQGDRFYPFT
ncbi:MAG: Arylsulfatase [Verrucomicrobiae bacterium]|nr:Arylsulfatase [Verrucomicrobiae bacterium]